MTHMQPFGVRLAFVSKEKKKVHKRPLTVQAYHVGRVRPHTPEIIAASKAKLFMLAKNDKERMMLEESKNRVESYIYKIKNKLEDDEKAISKVSTDKQRKECQKGAEDAEEWLYDAGYDADLATMEDKFAELSTPFEKIVLRLAEATARPEAVEKLKTKLKDVEALMKKWNTTMPQVTDEEKVKVTEKVDEVKKWLEKKEKEQSKKKGHDEPVLLSTDIPFQFEPIETLVLRLSKKPKPKPKKEKVDPKANVTDANATDATAGNTTDSNATDATDGNATAPESELKEESESETPKEGDATVDEL